jgi:hypothetical protein
VKYAQDCWRIALTGAAMLAWRPLRYNADSLKIGTSMKIRTLSLACVTATAAILLVGCTAVYKNTDACEQVMRGKLADVPVKQLPAATDSKLSIDHRGTGIDGTRVVVEASLSRMQTAAEAAASAAPAAGAPAVASAAKAASTQGEASAAMGASAPTAASAALVASDPAAAVSGASDAAASGASATVATAKAAKPAKPQKLVKAVAAECTFTGLNLASFRWLAPKELVQTDTAASEAAE